MQKKKTDKLGAEDDNLADMKEATEKLIELARKNKAFEGMRYNAKNKAVFGTFVSICQYIFAARLIGAKTHITLLFQIFSQNQMKLLLWCCQRTMQMITNN